MHNLKLTACFKCNKKLPRFMFKNLPEGWYSRSGHNFKCRGCSLEQPYRYKISGFSQFGKSLEEYEVSIKDRLEEFIEHDRIYYEFFLTIIVCIFFVPRIAYDSISGTKGYKVKKGS